MLLVSRNVHGFLFCFANCSRTRDSAIFQITWGCSKGCQFLQSLTLRQANWRPRRLATGTCRLCPVLRRGIANIDQHGRMEPGFSQLWEARYAYDNLISNLSGIQNLRSEFMGATVGLKERVQMQNFRMSVIFDWRSRSFLPFRFQVCASAFMCWVMLCVSSQYGPTRVPEPHSHSV